MVTNSPGTSQAAKRIWAAGMAYAAKQNVVRQKSPPALPLVRMPGKPVRDWLWVASDPMLHIKRHVEATIDEAARLFGVLPEEIRGKRTLKRIALARHFVIQRIQDETHLGCTTIGRMVGGRDHSSVLHACKPEQRAKVQRWLSGIRGRP